MTIRRATTLVPALLVLVALIATSCASGITQITADPAFDAGTSSSGSGHQYGTSIEDWSEGETASAEGASSGSEFAAISWDELVPPGQSEAEIFARYEELLDGLEYDSAEAEALYDELQEELYSKSFTVDAVNTDLDGQKIRLAGFVAPLVYDDDVVTEFLLVPSFGACIHVPPPPPNQTVLVTVDKADGLGPDEVWGAVWVEGTITVDAATTDLATASYSITRGASGVYTTS